MRTRHATVNLQTSDKHTTVAHLAGWQQFTVQSLQTASQALGASLIYQWQGLGVQMWVRKEFIAFK